MDDSKILERLARIEELIQGQNEIPMTLEAAAQYLGMTKSYLYKLTSTNQIPFYKPNGKRIYFEKRELTEWALRNRVATIEEVDQQAVNYLVSNRVSH